MSLLRAKSESTIKLLSGNRPHRVVRTPGMIQLDAHECGAVALGIVLAHHGRWVSIEELRAACGVSRNGSKAINVLRAARSYGLYARGVKLEPEGLRHLRPPAILHWHFTHFVVFEGLRRDGSVSINDPGKGRRKVYPSELDQSMTGVAMMFEPGPHFERGGQRKRLLTSLLPRLQGLRSALLFVFFVSLLLLVPGLLMPAFSRLFIDQVVLRRENIWGQPLAIAMGATMLILAVLTWLQRAFLLRFETRLAVDGAGQFFWHLLHLPIEFFNQRHAGDISWRVALNDKLAKFLSGDLAISGLNFVMLVFFAIVMFGYDRLLTVISIAIVLLNVLVLRSVARQRTEANMRLLREQSRLNGTALWGLETIEHLKATGTEGDLFARWAGEQAKVINLRQELEASNQRLDVLPPFLSAVNAALVLGLGGLHIMQGSLSLGGLMAFQMMTTAFTAPVNRLVSLSRRFQLAEGEMGLLDDVLHAKPAFKYAMRKPLRIAQVAKKLTGRVDVRGVSFGFSPLDPPFMKGIDLVLKPGCCVAVIGRTGSGKSTLAQLISGLYEPWQGEILFDGHLRSELVASVLTGSIAVVDQDISIFEGTILENLTLWNENVSIDNVVAALREACLLDEIMERPGRLHAGVAGGGMNWSGGQLQRLEIARALVGQPALLVMDEATSALDANTEQQILDNLRHAGYACLMIAHRLSTIRSADEIVVLQDGEIIQRGSHYELLQAQGPYAELVVNE